jgi:glutamate--cysteine ligase catalytic subunit
MTFRREVANQFMNPDEALLTITSFPILGQGDFLDPPVEARGNASRSMFVPDEIINPHARFPTLTANIRKRRGSKVAINMPIYKDINTPSPFIDPTIPHNRNFFPEDLEAATAALPDHIYMDSMCFGMGCCCLQTTFQAGDINEARRLYDQLIPLGPIMLALTAAAPTWRGYLADVDCRWNVIAGSVDCRTPEERGLKPTKPGQRLIAKSRYDSVDSYLSTDPSFNKKYNDINLVYDEESYETLTKAGIDDQLAKHISHLFIRDPLVIFEELVNQDNKHSSDHFENLQSTNWQTMRFKPPPPNSPIGWRVEFRSMEAQLTDFENAAFAVFIALMTRLIVNTKINTYIPISKVDENMKVAHRRGAVTQEKFYFRKYLTKESTPSDVADPDEYELMTIDEIINGKAGGFAGLIPTMKKFLDTQSIPTSTRQQLDKYLDLVEARANGSLITTATWIRNKITSHPDYKQDSVISESINYDLLKLINRLDAEGSELAPELLGNFAPGITQITK